MKSINTYITEKLVIGNNLDRGYNYFPKDIDELIACIKYKIQKYGVGTQNNPLNLNDIDTSEITDMDGLFSANSYFNCDLVELAQNGHFDISGWDVSNVKTMALMFGYSTFNGDISDWDVHNVKDMNRMFVYSDFTGKNGDISKWDVSNVKNMDDIFANCPLQNNPPKWYKY